MTNPKPADEAVLRDSALPDIDWAKPAGGAIESVFEAPSGRLAMVSLGDPSHPRVLMIPGVTGSKEDFTLMMPMVAAAGFFVQSFDLAGQYQSAGAGPELLDPPGERYEYDLFVHDLLAVIEGAAGERRAPVHILGYSFAAVVAQLAFVARPELFASLTFLSAPPQPGQGFRGISRIGRVTGIASDRIGAALMIWGIRRNFNRVSPGRLAFVETRFRYTRRDSVRDVIGLMKHAPDCRPALAASTIPLLVAVGEHDVWPVKLHAEFAGSIGARFAVYPGGHSPCETSPHQLTRDLLALLRSTSGSVA
ncbi:MAG: alpha/beta hydrolase [Actinomycetota bacterium]